MFQRHHASRCTCVGWTSSALPAVPSPNPNPPGTTAQASIILASDALPPRSPALIHLKSSGIATLPLMPPLPTPSIPSRPTLPLPPSTTSQLSSSFSAEIYSLLNLPDLFPWPGCHSPRRLFCQLNLPHSHQTTCSRACVCACAFSLPSPKKRGGRGGVRRQRQR